VTTGANPGAFEGRSNNQSGVCKQCRASDNGPAYGPPHYFCLRCDAERFQLYATGVIHCAQCGALMRNISVIEGEEGRAGSK